MAELDILNNIDDNTNFNVSYGRDEWLGILKKLTDAEKKDEFISCWGDYDLTLSGNVQKGIIDQFNVALKNEEKEVSLELKANENVSISRNGNIISYEVMLQNLREDLKESRLEAAKFKIRAACATDNKNVDSEQCEEVFTANMRKQTDELSDVYFLNLFGLKD